MMFQHADVWMGSNFLNQYLLDSFAGCVAAMNDASHAMATFFGEVVAGFITVITSKMNALINQPMDGSRRILGNILSDCFIT